MGRYLFFRYCYNKFSTPLPAHSRSSLSQTPLNSSLVLKNELLIEVQVLRPSSNLSQTEGSKGCIILVYSELGASKEVCGRVAIMETTLIFEKHASAKLVARLKRQLLSL